MRAIRYGVGTVLGTLALLLVTASVAEAVPAFSRQTGLTCNQCHISVTPVPDFTFTGTRFRLMGYRFPMIAETMEAGEEGALSGQRLYLAMHNYTSLHVRNNLLLNSRPATAPGVESEWGTLRTNPIATIGWYWVGPISERVGIWNEFYLHDSRAGEMNANFFNIAEWDLKYAVPVGNNILGLSMNTNQRLGTVFGFGPFGGTCGAPCNTNNHGVAGTGSQSQHMNFHAYGMFNDRIIAGIGVQPGEDNFDFDKRNYMGLLGAAIMNTDANYMWVVGEFLAGNSARPMVTNRAWSWSRDGGPGYVYRDAVSGVRATRVAGDRAGQFYSHEDMGDALRTRFEWRYGFVDRGPHSFVTSWVYGYQKETYEDAAEYTAYGIGTGHRYTWDRTYQIQVYAGYALSQEFVDQSGVLHDIPASPNWSVALAYRLSQNTNVNFAFSNSVPRRLDEKYDPGRSWTLQFHWMF